MFAGNTTDVATLPGVLDDLQARFGVGRICVVADRGLISDANIDAVADADFDHVLATRLHRHAGCAAALELCARPDAAWVPVPDTNAAACDVTLDDGRRCVVAASFARHARDTARTAELVACTEAKLLALEQRVRSGRLGDPAKIGRVAQRILGPSGVARLFDVEITRGQFLYHYNEDTFCYEGALAGRCVLATSLTREQASPTRVVRAYRQLQEVERRFRVLKDFVHLRPMRHWPERRVGGHVAVCVYATILETLTAAVLHQADIRDPDVDDQHLTPARALRELARIRHGSLTAGDVVQHHPPVTPSPATSRGTRQTWV